MNKLLISAAILMSGFGYVSAQSNGVMTANYNKKDGELRTFEITADLKGGVLTITNFAGIKSPIEFYIDLGTGDVESQNLKSLSLTNVHEEEDYTIPGEIENTPEGKSILKLEDWGSYGPLFGSIMGFSYTYYNTVIEFDFPIPGLPDPYTGPIVGVWDVNYLSFQHYPPKEVTQRYNVRVRNGNIYFNTVEETQLFYNYNMAGIFRSENNTVHFLENLIFVQYSGSYDVYQEGCFITDFDEWIFEPGSFTAQFDEQNLTLEFPKASSVSWLLLRGTSFVMQTGPLMFLSAEKLLDGENPRTLEISDIEYLRPNNFDVAVDAQYCPENADIQVWYRISDEGEFYEARHTSGMNFNIDISNYKLIEGTAYNLYVYATTGGTKSPVKEYEFIYSKDNGDSSVEAIDSDVNRVRYYNLQGMEIAKPNPGTICIRANGQKMEKVVVK